MRVGGGGGGGGLEGSLCWGRGSGTTGPGRLNKIGACPGGICKSVLGVGGRYNISFSRGGYIYFAGGGGGGEGGGICLQLLSSVGVYG